MFERPLAPSATTLSPTAGMTGLIQAEVLLPERLKAADKVVCCGATDSPSPGLVDENRKPAAITVALGGELARRLGGKRVAPLQQGELIEPGPAVQVSGNPHHPRTRELLSRVL